MIQTLAARTGMSVRKPRASGDDPRETLPGAVTHG